MTKNKLDPFFNKKPIDKLFVECTQTPLERIELFYYLKEGWKLLYGTYPSFESLSILWAHTVLESGGSKIRNNNFGNIKAKPNKKYTSYECGEYLSTGYQMFYPYHPQTFFMSWDSPLEGAVGYIDYISAKNRTAWNAKQYQIAFEELQKGNIKGYCYWIKKAGFFTAPFNKYLDKLVQVQKIAIKNKDKFNNWTPKKIEQQNSNKKLLIVDNIQGTDKEKLNTLSTIFVTIWSYILKALTYLKIKT